MSEEKKKEIYGRKEAAEESMQQLRKDLRTHPTGDPQICRPSSLISSARQQQQCRNTADAPEARDGNSGSK